MKSEGEIEKLLLRGEGVEGIKRVVYSVALKLCDGNRTKAAQLLMVSIRAFRNYLNAVPSVKKHANKVH